MKSSFLMFILASLISFSASAGDYCLNKAYDKIEAKGFEVTKKVSWNYWRNGRDNDNGGNYLGRFEVRGCEWGGIIVSGMQSCRLKVETFGDCCLPGLRHWKWWTNRCR